MSCLNCPENTYSEKNSIGSTSCISKRPCIINDAEYIEDNYFSKENEIYNLATQFKLNPLSDCDKSKLSEFNKILSNYNYQKNIISEKFDFCKEGLCINNLNNENQNNYTCSPCEENK